MDELKRKEIENLIESCLSARGNGYISWSDAERVMFGAAPDLADQAKLLMSELKLRTESYNQCAAGLQAANAKCDRLERELEELRAKPTPHDEVLVERLTYVANDCSSGREAAIAILSELASMPVELDSDELFDEMLKAYAIGIGGTANGAGIVAVREALRVRLAPLFAARKATELPSHDELIEWFNSGYGEAEGEHIADHESSVSNGIRVLREKLAKRFGKKTRTTDDEKAAPTVVKTESTPNPERGLRQRFVEATKALGKDPYGRTATTDDLFTLIALLDKPKSCSSVEAVTRAVQALNVHVLRKDPETKSLTDGSWLTIASELSKHLDYEPTMCAGFIQLRDGRIEFDHDKGVLVFSYFIP